MIDPVRDRLPQAYVGARPYTDLVADLCNTSALDRLPIWRSTSISADSTLCTCSSSSARRGANFRSGKQDFFECRAELVRFRQAGAGDSNCADREASFIELGQKRPAHL